MNTHYVVTNREIITSPRKQENYKPVNDEEFIRIDGKELSTENLRFGKYSFDDPDDEGKLEIFKEEDIDTFDPADSSKTLPSDNQFDELYKSMKKAKKGKGEVLIFIHGYKSDLDRSLDTLRKLHYTYAENSDCPVKHIVLFSWPAMKNIFKYRSDARDAKTTGYALGRAIHKVAEFMGKRTENDCGQRIHLMAHSMGNRVLEAMMEQLSDAEEEKLGSLFHEVILVGADVDYDALESPRPLYDLIDICERIHVFYHRKDAALTASQTTKNDFNRLGKYGAKNTGNLPDDIYQYDISHTRDDLTSNIFENQINHWSYYTSSEVVEMIIDVLSDFQEEFKDEG
jgi:esterase/lipase superfamily enzyme